MKEKCDNTSFANREVKQHSTCNQRVSSTYDVFHSQLCL